MSLPMKLGMLCRKHPRLLWLPLVLLFVLAFKIYMDYNETSSNARNTKMQQDTEKVILEDQKHLRETLGH